MIAAQRLERGWLVWLPLPPSTNRRMRPVRMGRFARQILTNEARDYHEVNALKLNAWARGVKFQALSTFTHLDLWVILSRSSQDCSNFDKILLDTIEKARLVTNDKFLLPRFQGVLYDATRSCIIIYLPQEKP